MSGKWISLVWEEYPGGGRDYRLALAIADNTAFDEDLVYIKPTARLLHMARLAEKEFPQALARIMANGWLELVDEAECLYQFVIGPRTKRSVPPPRVVSPRANSRVLHFSRSR